MKKVIYPRVGGPESIEIIDSILETPKKTKLKLESIGQE